MSRALTRLKFWFNEPIYPLLFGLYPVLFLYSQNIQEVTIDAIWIPLWSSLIGVIVLFFVGKWLFKDWSRAAIWTFLIAVLFFSYGSLARLLPDELFKIGRVVFGANKVLFPLFVIGIVLFSWWWKRMNFNVNRVNYVLNLVTTILLFISLVTIVPIEFGRTQVKSSDQPANTLGAQIQTNPNQNKPDVFYLIFDRYTGKEALSQTFHFDNAPFLNWMTNQGFYVANQSLDNYPKTSYSLSSTFTMNFHPTYQNGDGAYPTEATDIYPLFQNNPVQKMFHSLGYKNYALGSWFEPSIQPEGFDGVYQYQPLYWLSDSFQSQYLETTMAMPVVALFIKDDISNDTIKHQVYAQYQMDTYPAVFSLSGPKFVFTHVLLPHPPFIYNADCQVVAQNSTTTQAADQEYLQQLQCANKVIQGMVSYIKQESQGKAVIVVQSDEGSGVTLGMSEWGNNMAKSNDKDLLVRTNILNTYYFPDQDYSRLTQDMTSVNTFRIIFDKYFGQQYDLLPNTTYAFQDPLHVFNYVDVTDRMKQQLKKSD